MPVSVAPVVVTDEAGLVSTLGAVGVEAPLLPPAPGDAASVERVLSPEPEGDEPLPVAPEPLPPPFAPVLEAVLEPVVLLEPWEREAEALEVEEEVEPFVAEELDAALSFADEAFAEAEDAEDPFDPVPVPLLAETSGGQASEWSSASCLSSFVSVVRLFVSCCRALASCAWA